jgi:3-oxoacyl-[acyl-carrier protein] reductase
MGKLSGKVTLVTGASKGIGAGIAKELAAQGASVVVNYATSKQGAEAVVKTITDAGGKAVAVGGSVAKAADIASIFAEVKKQFGRLDVLVNNAGVYEFGALEAITEERINWMFATNVTGLLLTTQAASALFPAEGGSVINISSIVTSLAPPTSVVYTATKGAVDSITRVLAKELGARKIRVNAVSPGLVATEGVESAGFRGTQFEEQAVAATPLGRIGQPEDIASVVAFLASDDARWITGSILEAGGGQR